MKFVPYRYRFYTVYIAFVYTSPAEVQCSSESSELRTCDPKSGEDNMAQCQGHRAPSLILYHKDNNKADIATQDVLVPSHGCAKFTYYCCICWNVAHEGGGYCGIQDRPNEKVFIFSLWDPIKTKEAIVPVFTGQGTLISRFAGEGTGLKSVNFGFGWKPDQWYTMVTRRWDHGRHTRFGFWVHDQTSSKWRHLVTMDYPVPGVYFRKTSSFMEAWRGTGHVMRNVRFKDTWKRMENGTWKCLREARFFVNKSVKSRRFDQNYNAHVRDGHYFMQVGHTTSPDCSLGSSENLVCRAPDDDSEAELGTPAIRFIIESMSRSQLTWRVPEYETPQFKYTIKDGDKILASDVDSEARTCHVDLSRASQVTLVLEDILGREASLTMDLSSTPAGCQSPA